MVLVHTVMSRKEDGSAPAEMSRQLALGDAESSPADLTSATTNTNIQEALGSPQCLVWAKQWLRETQGQEQWGFARYIDHGDIRERLREENHLFEDELDEEEPRLVVAYKDRTAKLVRIQHKRIGYGKALSRQFRLQGMTWPQSRVDKAQSKQKFLDGDVTDRFEDDILLRAKFQVLRTRFKALRDRPRDTVMDKDTKRKGLRPGLLSNVFIVVDKACMDFHVTLNEKYDVEHGLVFVVDREYEDPGPMEPLASKVRHQYRGFV